MSTFTQLTKPLHALIPSPERGGNLVRAAWDRLHPWPGGTWMFSRLVGRIAPYTSTVHAHVVELRHGYAKVTMADRKFVRNHIRCVHAIALANLAEVTGNVALAYALPDDARFIVAAMSIEYLKKARGTITGICHSPTPETNARQEYEVHVSLLNTDGEEVTHAVLRTLVGPKRG